MSDLALGAAPWRAPSRSTLAPRAAIALATGAAASSGLACLAYSLVGAPAGPTLLAIDGGLTLAALGLASAKAWRPAALIVLAVTLNFAVLAALSNSVELKTLRDPLVLVAFLLLGWTHGSRTIARAAFFIVAGLAVGVGLVEWFSPATYTSVFDVLGFYIARGEVSEERAALLESNLFVSGLRPSGRYFLSFLGPHRVSSIFLEPVAMGNFGVIAAAYGLSRPSNERRAAIAALVVAAFAIVAADARFALMTVVFLVIARFAPLRADALVVLLMPLAALAGIVTWGVASGVGYGDDLPTRLAHSGRVVAEMTMADWFGVARGRLVSFDAGYYYLLRGLGLVMAVVLWTCFAFLPARSREARRYKLMLAIYMTLLLTISGSSLFALKTAGIAFFLLGSMLREDYGPPRLA